MSTDTPAVPTRPAAAMAKRAITVLLVGLIIGTVTAFIAIAFVETVLWLNDVLLISAYAKVQSGFAFWQIALIPNRPARCYSGGAVTIGHAR